MIVAPSAVRCASKTATPSRAQRALIHAQYAQACRSGRQRAAKFALHLLQHPEQVEGNVLADVFSSIAADDPTGGVRVGFNAYLERLIHRAALVMDVREDVEHIDAQDAAIAAKRNNEPLEG